MADDRGEPGSDTLSMLSEIEAAGVVPWRRGPDGPEVLLVHRPRRDDWSLAKGKREPGEELPQTAIREVAEETGLRLLAGAPEDRSLPGRRPPQAGGVLGRGEPVRPGPGRVRPQRRGRRGALVPAAAGLGTAVLRYRCRRAQGLRALAAPDRPARGAAARLGRAQKDWTGDDLLRPLDFKGQSQARTLVSLLGCFGPVRVVSSPAVRCLATIEPYAGHVESAGGG